MHSPHDYCAGKASSLIFFLVVVLPITSLQLDFMHALSYILIAFDLEMNLILVLVLLCLACSLQPSCCDESNTNRSCVVISLPFSSGEERALFLTNPKQQGGSNDVALIAVNSKIPFSTLVSILELKTDLDSRGNNSGPLCDKIIGIVGVIDSTIAKFATNCNLNLNVTLVAALTPPPSLPVTDLSTLPNVLDLNPLSHYIQATVSFIEQWNLTCITVISEDTYYHQYAAELLYKELLQDSKREVSPMLVRTRYNSTKIVQGIEERGVRVLILSTTKELACGMLGEARKLNLIWPQYAWIVIQFEQEYSTSLCSLVGAIVVHRPPAVPNLPGLNLSAALPHMHLEEEAVSNVDLAKVYAYALTIANMSAIQMHGGDISEYTLVNNISVSLLANASQELEIACYQHQTKRLNMLFNLTKNSFSCNTKFIDYRTPKGSIIVVSVIIIFCFIFVTVVFILYIQFHREPEIKATSVSVSLCMFFGCYLLLLFVPTYIVEEQPGGIGFISPDVMCSVLAWLSCAGAPNTLIAATLIVKMLRVYAIFEDPFSYRNKCKRLLFHDGFLFLYIILLTLPHTVLLISWSAYDPLLSRKEIHNAGTHYLSTDRCLSTKTSIYTWIIVQLTYSFVLLFFLVVLSIKTSKIRYKNFQDAKATNAFVFITVFGTVSTIFYWSFFRMLESSATNLQAAEHTAYIGSIVIAMSNQMFLFVPKVYPPFKRWMRRKCGYTSDPSMTR